MRITNILFAISLIIIYPPLMTLVVICEVFANMLQAAWYMPQVCWGRQPMPSSFWPHPFWSRPLQRGWQYCWQMNSQANDRPDMWFANGVAPRVGQATCAVRPGITSIRRVGGASSYAKRPGTVPGFFSPREYGAHHISRGHVGCDRSRIALREDSYRMRGNRAGTNTDTAVNYRARSGRSHIATRPVH